MAYPKLTPIVATGATEPRYVADRFADVVHVKDYGAKCDGITDDTASLQAAIDAAAAGSCLVTIDGKILIDSADITVKKGVSIVGNSISCGNYLSQPISDSNQSVIVLNSDYSIILKESSAIKNLRILNKGLNISSGTVSAFTGTAIKSTYNYYGIAIENIQLMGFLTGIKLVDVFQAKIHNLLSDAIVGIDASGGEDVGTCVFAYLEDCLFDRVTYPGVDLASDIRDGSKGFKLDNCNSFTMTNCYAHCHDTGYEITNCTKIYLRGCVADYYSSDLIADRVDAIGVKIEDTTYSVVESSEVSHYGTSLIINDSDVRVVGNILRQFTKYGLRHLGESKSVVLGNLFIGYQITSGTNSAYGVEIEQNNDSLVLANNNFSGKYIEQIKASFDIYSAGFKLDTKNNVGLAGNSFPVVVKKQGEFPGKMTICTNGSYLGWQEQFRTCTGNVDNPSALADGNDVATYRFFGYNGSTYAQLASIKISQYGNTGGAIRFGTNLRNDAGYAYDRIIISDLGDIFPGADDLSTLGHADKRFKQLYAVTGTINTSDERVKEDIKNVSNDMLEAWGELKYKTFKFKSAVSEKGESARTHIGLVAQDIERAFRAKNIDGFKYGLLCHDTWDEEEHAYIEPNTNEKITCKTDAGDRYSLRYDEVFALESAYLRWRLEQLEKRVNQLTNNSNK